MRFFFTWFFLYLRNYYVFFLNENLEENVYDLIRLFGFRRFFFKKMEKLMLKVFNFLLFYRF